MKIITVCLILTSYLAIGLSQSRRPPSPTRPVIAKLPDGLIQQLASDNDEVRKYLNESPDRAKNFEARLIDLNGDGKPEYQISNDAPDDPKMDFPTRRFCFMEGTCTFWLYRKTSDGWELLLTTDAPILPLKTSTNGYRDLSRHASVGATHEYTTIYKFDGTNYHAKECFEYEYTKVSRSGIPFARKLISQGPCKD